AEEGDGDGDVELGVGGHDGAAWAERVEPGAGGSVLWRLTALPYAWTPPRLLRPRSPQPPSAWWTCTRTGWPAGAPPSSSSSAARRGSSTPGSGGWSGGRWTRGSRRGGRPSARRPASRP